MSKSTFTAENILEILYDIEDSIILKSEIEKIIKLSDEDFTKLFTKVNIGWMLKLAPSLADKMANTLSDEVLSGLLIAQVLGIGNPLLISKALPQIAQPFSTIMPELIEQSKIPNKEKLFNKMYVTKGTSPQFINEVNDKLEKIYKSENPILIKILEQNLDDIKIVFVDKIPQRDGVAGVCIQGKLIVVSKNPPGVLYDQSGAAVSTLLHELTHAFLFTKYKNGSEPYVLGAEESFDKIITAMQKEHEVEMCSYIKSGGLKEVEPSWYVRMIQNYEASQHNLELFPSFVTQIVDNVLDRLVDDRVYKEFAGLLWTKLEEMLEAKSSLLPEMLYNVATEFDSSDQSLASEVIKIHNKLKESEIDLNILQHPQITLAFDCLTQRAETAAQYKLTKIKDKISHPMVPALLSYTEEHDAGPGPHGADTSTATPDVVELSGEGQDVS